MTPPQPTLLADGFGTPRGVKWDRDGTVYVADSSRGSVSALPAYGLEKVDPELVVQLHGAFDVAIISGSDPGLKIVMKQNFDGGRFLAAWN